LQKLIDELAERGSSVAESAQFLAETLAEAYFAERYPGFDLEDPDWPKLRDMLTKVTTLLDVVKTQIGYVSK